VFRRALTEQCLHWSSFPTGEAEGAFAGGHEDLLVGEAHGKADGGVEVGGFEDLEVALGGVMAFGAVDDGLGGGVPSNFLEGKGMTEQILSEALATGGLVGVHRARPLQYHRTLVSDVHRVLLQLHRSSPEWGGHRLHRSGEGNESDGEWQLVLIHRFGRWRKF
jgi:hypothetical protein